MDDGDLFEPDTSVFTGTVKSWSPSGGEIVTDSGITVVVATVGQAAVPIGTRLTVTVRKFRPRYQIIKAVQA